MRAALKLLLSFAAGALFGATLGVLFAPEKGFRVRRGIARTAGKWAEKATDGIEAAGDKVEAVRRKLA